MDYREYESRKTQIEEDLIVADTKLTELDEGIELARLKMAPEMQEVLEAVNELEDPEELRQALSILEGERTHVEEYKRHLGRTAVLLEEEYSAPDEL